MVLFLFFLIFITKQFLSSICSVLPGNITTSSLPLWDRSPWHDRTPPYRSRWEKNCSVPSAVAVRLCVSSCSIVRNAFWSLPKLPHRYECVLIVQGALASGPEGDEITLGVTGHLFLPQASPWTLALSTALTRILCWRRRCAALWRQVIKFLPLASSSLSYSPSPLLLSPPRGQGIRAAPDLCGFFTFSDST